jgi:hypothetical protein
VFSYRREVLEEEKFLAVGPKLLIIRCPESRILLVQHGYIFVKYGFEAEFAGTITTQFSKR